MHYDPDKLTEALRRYRVAAIADELGVGRDHLYKVMRGERPLSDELARRLALVLDIDVADLVADQPQPAHV